MTYTFKLPKTIPITIQWIIKLWFIYFIIFTASRILTVFLFRPGNIPYSSLLPSFLLGFQYDVKWIAIILLPIALLSLYNKFSPFYSEKNKRWWTYYLALATLLVLFFFSADFGNFSYNHTRINASALNFSQDFIISFKMLWQSYPMIWILSGLALAVALIAKLIKKTHVSILKRNIRENKIYKRRWHAVAIFFMLWCLYGIFSFTPLKWSEAFKFNDTFKSNLALNPLQNFFTTLRFRAPVYDDEKAKEYFPVISNFLSLNDKNNSANRYERIAEPGGKALESRPNVVLVICESFSMYKSSMSGNPLNTTPYFNDLTQQGIFFNRCFSATFGTARGVFAILTGTPDVQLSQFSTRNPEAINQHTIINNFEDYDKMYFIGGNSNFNNFEGLIKNINGVKIYQDSFYKSPKLNVWGISDKNLFLEANEELRKQTKPFFAIIQTADNHRPYSIPEEDNDFERRIVPPDTLTKYGFESLQEFQAFCYTDYCFKKFIEAAKQQPYFDNTIFVFTGDHGVEGNALEMYPNAWTSSRLSDEHVPLLFYAPRLLMPHQRNEVASQIDILPTLAGMIHQPYTNTTLGRDLLSPNTKLNAAFIIHHDEGNIGVVTDKYFYVKNIRMSTDELIPVTSNTIDLSAVQKDSAKKSLSSLTSAIYETAKWMLVNNKKSLNEGR
jgi:phosphoglycerol transferase MdoB-like AlkP superfamily enzyme